MMEVINNHESVALRDWSTTEREKPQQRYRDAHRDVLNTSCVPVNFTVAVAIVCDIVLLHLLL